MRHFRIVDRAYGTLLDLAARRRERRRWSVPLQRAGGPRVFYGIDHVPARTERAAGGMIKCQDLAAVFPNTVTGANILYLVSSSLPFGCVPMHAFAKRAGARVVINQDGVAYPAWHGPGWDRANAPMKALVHGADYVFYQSEFSRAGSDRYLGVRQGPSEILYNPVDTTVFRPAATPPSTLTLLISGSHWRPYRVRTAIETLALVREQVRDARLIVAGRLCWTSDPAEAERESRELCCRLSVESAVEFRGPYSQTEAVSVMQSAGILLHTAYNDVCPRLVVEAMACGLPVVYSATGGVPELVGPDGGIGIPGPLDWEEEHPPCPSELAEAVMKVAVRYSKYSMAARQRAERKLDVLPWIARHEEVFGRLLG